MAEFSLALKENFSWRHSYLGGVLKLQAWVRRKNMASVGCELIQTWIPQTSLQNYIPSEWTSFLYKGWPLITFWGSSYCDCFSLCNQSTPLYCARCGVLSAWSASDVVEVSAIGVGVCCDSYIPMFYIIPSLSLCIPCIVTITLSWCRSVQCSPYHTPATGPTCGFLQFLSYFFTWIFNFWSSCNIVDCGK